MWKYDYDIIKNILSFLIYYFQHIEMSTMEHTRDLESNVEVAATSASVPPPKKADKSTNTELSVRN